MKKYTINTALLFIALLSCLFAKAQETGHWDLLKTGSKPEARSECGLAAVDGKLYLVGGDGPAYNVEVFDPATLTWAKKAAAPVQMHHFEAVSLGKKVYVLDAFYEGGFPNQTPAPNAYSYDTETDSWQQLAGLPAERRRGGAGAASYNGKLYLVAGIKNGHSSGTNNLFDAYDPATNTWTALPDAPHIRDHSQAVVIGDKLYAVGGRNTSYHEPNNFMAFFDKTVLDVDCYDFKTGKWSVLDAKLPKGTGGGTAVGLDGKLFYIGGERATSTLPNGPQKDVYYLDVNNPVAWVKAADLNKARNGVGGTVLDHKIYIAGGAGGDPGGPPPNGNMPGGPPPNQPQGNQPMQGPPRGPGPGGHGGDIALEVFSF
jgi:N-acetylneuraminic acid mutarotase